MTWFDVNLFGVVGFNMEFIKTLGINCGFIFNEYLNKWRANLSNFTWDTYFIKYLLELIYLSAIKKKRKILLVFEQLTNFVPETIRRTYTQSMFIDNICNRRFNRVVEIHNYVFFHLDEKKLATHTFTFTFTFTYNIYIQ